MRRLDRLAYYPLSVFLALALVLGSPVRAAPPGVDRVEEDWELVLGTPAVPEAGPQITTTFSPQADITDTFFTFNLNYRGTPFRPGGLQVRA